MDNFEKEIKKEFQLERLILFSDAVFAIAITLLVIEIKVPHIESNVNDNIVWHELLHLLPKFFGFVLSFFIIGIYWTVHHRLFSYLTNYDSKLIWLNILFLFSIALMPFTTALYSEFYQQDLHIPHLIYTINICLTGFCSYLLVKHLAYSKNKITTGFQEENLVKTAIAKSWMIPTIFVIGLGVSYIFPAWLGRMSPMLIPVYLWFVNKKYKH
ncbi:MAG: TMEM175 family protein [Flavobacterium sp.]